MSSSEGRLAERSRNERKNRDTLLDSSRRRKNNQNKNNKSKQMNTASEAQSIQKSLLRTQSLLKNELQRVSHVQEAIEEDGKVLQQTMDQHKSLNTKHAQQALTGLQRAQQHEQRVLMASVAFFCFVSFNILWSRVIVKFDFVSPFLFTNDEL